MPLCNYVFFIKLKDLNDCIKIFECNLNLGFNHKCIDKDKGSLYYAGNNSFN